MFPRLLSPTGRDTQWNVSPGQLGQTEAGEWIPAQQAGCPQVRRQAGVMYQESLGLRRKGA
jgi:hypothetical protein